MKKTTKNAKRSGKTSRTSNGARRAPKAKRAAAGRDPAKRDARIPADGTVISREYHDKTHLLTVRPNGFELAGVVYPTLTAAAKTLVKCEVNGFLFWGLNKKAAAAAK